MNYLFKGMLPPELPPVPNIELRPSNGQRKEELLAREVRTCAHPHSMSPLSQRVKLHVSWLGAGLANNDWACQLSYRRGHR